MDAEDTVELDYDDPMDDKIDEGLEEKKETLKTLESSKKTEKAAAPVSSIFDRVEGLKREEEIRETDEKSNQDHISSDFFASGRVSFAKADESSHQDGVEEENEDEEREAFEEIIYPEPNETFPTFPITSESVKEELRVTSQHLRNAIVVHGIENMNEYAIMRIFGKYNVSRLDPVDKNAALIQFRKKKSALIMMTEMAKTLSTNEARFEEHAKLHKETTKDEESEETNPEDGEVEHDEDTPDDETNVKMINFEKLSCYRTGYPDLRVTSHAVYINPNKYLLPEKKWRVVTSHIGQGRVALVRFATKAERKVAQEKDMSTIIGQPENVDQETGLEFRSKDRLRQGLNVFNKEGEELEWDFGHDDRFYQKAGIKEEENEWQKPELQVGIKGAVKVRGRGAKRFLGEDSTTMTADEVSKPKKQPRKSEDGPEGPLDDDWRSNKPSSKPTKVVW